MQRSTRQALPALLTLGLLVISAHLTVVPAVLSAASADSASSSVPSSTVSQEGRLYAGEGWLEVRNGMRVAHFKGTPREIGAQHALLLGLDAQRLGEAMIPGGQLDDQASSGAAESSEAGGTGAGSTAAGGSEAGNPAAGGSGAGSSQPSDSGQGAASPTQQPAGAAAQVPNADQMQAYMQAYVIPALLRQTPPRYIEEMKGFTAAIGAGDTMEAVVPLLMGNAAHDLGLVLGVGGGPGGADAGETAEGACSAFAAWGSATADGRLIHGRNLDYLGLRGLGQLGLVAIYEPTGYYPFIAVTYPGLFGVMQGMNSKGISISMTYSLTRPPHVSIDGMPFMFLLRRVLEEAATLDEALSIIEKTPRTIGLTILVADGKIPAARVIEVCADRYAVREPQTGTVWATNRYETAAMKEVQMPGWLASERRDQSLRRALTSAALPLDVQRAVGLLRDRSTDGSLVGRVNNPGTIISSVFAPATLQMWAAVVPERGTAADSRFHAFDLAAELGLPSQAVAPATDIAAVDPAADPEVAGWQAAVEAAYREDLGDLPKAEAAARQALTAFPQSEAALLILGRVLHRQGKDDEAASLLQRLVRLPAVQEPHNLLEAWYILGVIAEQRGQLGQAAAAYQAALAVPIPPADLAVGDPLQQKAGEALGRIAKGQ